MMKTSNKIRKKNKERKYECLVQENMREMFEQLIWANITP